MRPRSIGLIAAAVLGVHLLVLWGPGDAWTQAQPDVPAEVARLDTVWISPPVAAPAPPPPAPRPVRQTRARPATPEAATAPLPVPAPATDMPAPPQPDTVATAVPDGDPTPPEAAPAQDSRPADTPPGAPHWQVRGADGQPLAAALPAAATDTPQHQTLRYRVHGWIKGLEYHAQAELSWHTEGGRYQARQSISAFLLGSLEQTSRGRIGAEGFQPERFDDRRLTRLRSATLDWEAQLARFEPERPPAAIGPGTQDRLSVFLQLSALLEHLPALRAPGTLVEIPTLGSRSLQMWQFRVQDTDTLALPSGPLATLRLQRAPQSGDREQALLWLAPALGYAPVRIQMQESNGDHLTLTLRELP